MKIFFFLFLCVVSDIAFAESSKHSWGGACSFRGEKVNYEFSSKSGDVTNDDMSLVINGNAVPVPNALYLRSNIYFKGVENLCDGGLAAFEYQSGYLFAMVRDGRPSGSFIIFFYYDLAHKKLFNFLDPEINLKYSSDDDGFPLVMKFENGRYLFRAVNEMLFDKRTQEKIILDGWFELKILNGKIRVESRM